MVGVRFTHHTNYVLLSLYGDCGNTHNSNSMSILYMASIGQLVALFFVFRCTCVHTLAAVKSKEDYDSMSESLKNCFDSINFEASGISKPFYLQ